MVASKVKKILQINVSADPTQWDRYVDLTVKAHNTTYHQTRKCSPTETFYERVPYNNAHDLKFSNPLSSPRNAADTQSLVDNLNSKFKENARKHSQSLSRVQGVSIERHKHHH